MPELALKYHLTLTKLLPMYQSTEEKREAWKLALSEMYVTYNQVKEQELEEHICTIESAHDAA